MQHAARVLELMHHAPTIRGESMVIDGEPTPCDDSTAWFVEDLRKDSEPGVFISADDRRANREAILRAKLTCATRCRWKRQCMETALDIDHQDNNWVWGGYTGHERSSILNDGPLKVPAEVASQRYNLDPARADEFLDHHLTLEEAADRWGVTLRHAEYSLKYHIWNRRLRAGDPWVTLHDRPVSVTPVDATSTESSDTVRAA